MSGTPDKTPAHAIDVADISETALLQDYGSRVVENMLKDHTTRQNIFWATDSYAHLGAGYGFFDPITIDKVTGPNDRVVRPRALKSREEQAQRVKDKAEVFTPSWICNAQNNLVDEAWFGRKDVFNRPDPHNPQGWIDTEETILFPGTEGKTWRDYVADTRLEITCGEAPYLASRYDTVSGEYIYNVRHRIGMLDRKLRVVSENTHTSREWLLWGKVALRATYGFEWQGDNLLLAREALFFSFVDHYKAKFGKEPTRKCRNNAMDGVAYIVSWNVWQMDGLTLGLPGHEVREKTLKPILEAELAKLPPPMELFPDEAEQDKPSAIRRVTAQVDAWNASILPHQRLCLVKDFLAGTDLHNPKLTSKYFADRMAPKHTFKSITENQE